jgi:hypothetical protein
MEGRPPLYSSPEEMQTVLDLFFATETKPTITGVAIALGFESRQSFYDYEEKPEFTYIIKKARLRVENGYEKQLYEGAPTGAIFALKNMGWKDKSEVENSGTMAITWNEQKSYQTK